jgi:hypothetical protein
MVGLTDFTTKFKAANGVLLVRQLFLEMNLESPDRILYTIKSEDYQGYPSFYRLYMESVEHDPLEYDFANTYLDGWEHWEKLQEAEWFKPYIEKWRREADIRLKSRALRRVLRESKSDSREALAASRYLIEKGWVDKDTKTKRGRPSKEEIKKEVDRQVEMENRLQADMQRIGLN